MNYTFHFNDVSFCFVCVALLLFYLYHNQYIQIFTNLMDVAVLKICTIICNVITFFVL